MRMKESVAYPVFLLCVDNKGYAVRIPDFDQYTEGKDLADAICMARDAIGMMGIYYEDRGKAIPAPGSAKADLDRKQREQLINASTEGVNAASRSFLGFLRDSFETAMARNPEGDPVPVAVYADLAGHEIADPEWDGYECSVLKRLADNVAISIRGREVDLKVSKNFAG